MHLPDGILSWPILLTDSTIAAAGIAVGLKKIQPEQLPRIALLTSAFFVASLVHIPIGPTSTHLMLSGLIGIILGSAALPAIFIALLLQAVMFGHGGITTLGVNTLIMAMPALAIYLLFNQLVNKYQHPLTLFILGFLAGSLAIMISTLLLAATLIFTGKEFVQMVKLIIIAHLPVMAIEGLITAFIIITLKRLEPELINNDSQLAVAQS